jgi:hypothetical protein
MPKKKKLTENPHRVVIEVDKAQFQRFRAQLLSQHGQTVSDWFRVQMDKVLNEPVQGKFRTRYGRY